MIVCSDRTVIHFHPSMAVPHFVGPWLLLQFRNLFYTNGRTALTSDQPVARALPTHRTTQTQNKLTQTSMLWVGFAPTIPVFERAKTVHTLYRAANVIGDRTTSKNYFMNGRNPGMHIGYLWEIQNERDHWEDQNVGGWTLLKLILER
jgi:hypothetical protein